MGHSFTLTALEGGQSARLPALRLTLTPPSGAAVSTPLGFRAVVAGTSPECDLTVADPRVSRRHCELRLTERGVSLRDLGSKNGTFVGEMQIFDALLPPSVPVKLGAPRSCSPRSAMMSKMPPINALPAQ